LKPSWVLSLAINAHVAFYPGGNFGAVAEPGAYTGFPVPMLLGDKDENLPVTKIESYLAYARVSIGVEIEPVAVRNRECVRGKPWVQGDVRQRDVPDQNDSPIQTIIYPGAYHAWTVPNLTTARFNPDLVSTKKCPLNLFGQKRPAFLINGEAKPFDPTAFGACVAAAPGYSTGFDAAVRAQSIADTVSFLQRSLRP
jgi:dienelactone hydrolase